MNFYLTILAILVIFHAVASKNHKTLVFLSILSIIADNFRTIYFGPSLLLINIVGFAVIPLLVANSNFIKRNINKYTKPFIAEYVYLILLGVLFGFIIPWEDITGLRTLTQQAQGRTVVTLIRMLNEFAIMFYFAWVIYFKKIELDTIVLFFAITSLFSFWIGLIDYNFDYVIKEHLFYAADNIRGRFVGLNFEPKKLGRHAALAYGIIFYYYLYIKKKQILLFAIITNVIAVVLSSSASSFILFVLINFIVLKNFKSRFSKYYIIFIALIILTFSVLQEYVFDFTYSKVQKAIMGVEDFWIPNEPKLFTRFDIFDRLSLIFLWNNPKYLISGVGPNLISIPASEFIPSTSIFSLEGRIDSVPNVFLINVLSRSGIIGVLLYLVGLLRIYRLTKNNSILQAYLLLAVLTNMVYVDPFFLVIVGIIIGKQQTANSKHNTIQSLRAPCFRQG
ncbi:hypothetical protein SAMN02746065_10279 [Desulfocicer vacuolatum DSM 3385]|uniref:Oligosaccharide repeat unit polymerase n=1 Tax=Desulfocicer vacuolatum DSM 3385 TaxID=1121400 RepID=A0A1W1Z4R5_9BACT|nr:hypothetical protein [Desulfocicer vacuolatum]SMC43435.1 hypothetical protein SAMN02746065_10279 [Desulfocicer vacuolatum DSM 3385]